ncbi:hypothetical protein BAUCODRAFT_33127 [Baudoinia panamericana UAMH 10762]|uniref:Uncharacterized protein n=1 Tax=Baudoinia panamericana (strain UAMH 10762) TaxID=717646 RepID=M2ML52_BAUPA|nr:uncharacterized protein BAUCODRAFT_33127 [Baudoinia panamericana UAMH 10762]EMC97411.1 hypothetical protein BAUCODRAFT_33127 [Baudoinia panamericana UAMH 10762]
MDFPLRLSSGQQNPYPGGIYVYGVSWDEPILSHGIQLVLEELKKSRCVAGDAVRLHFPDRELSDFGCHNYNEPIMGPLESFEEWLKATAKVKRETTAEFLARELERKKLILCFYAGHGGLNLQQDSFIAASSSTGGGHFFSLTELVYTTVHYPSADFIFFPHCCHADRLSATLGPPSSLSMSSPHNVDIITGCSGVGISSRSPWDHFAMLAEYWRAKRELVLNAENYDTVAELHHKIMAFMRLPGFVLPVWHHLCGKAMGNNVIPLG